MNKILTLMIIFLLFGCVEEENDCDGYYISGYNYITHEDGS